jgi:hypothetical protein
MDRAPAHLLRLRRSLAAAEAVSHGAGSVSDPALQRLLRRSACEVLDRSLAAASRSGIADEVPASAR